MKKPGRDLSYAGNAGFSYDSMQWILVDGLKLVDVPSAKHEPLA